MRVLAIGDIHGCSRSLDCLLAAIGPRSSDLIVTLGDYVDRGPNSAGVIERLLRLREKRRVVCLRGNHEQLMLQARKGHDRFVEWVHSGARPTLASYAHGHQGKVTLRDVPRAHWEFLETGCVDWHETDTHLFVHAGIDPGLPMGEQPDFMLRWQRFGKPEPHTSGKIMVCGHTPQQNGTPRNFGHAICIDTGAYRQGWLTCLEVTTGYLWQTNESGELRSGWLSDIPQHAGVEVY
jgi:serine/threonine protein phosphatase 1